MNKKKKTNAKAPIEDRSLDDILEELMKDYEDELDAYEEHNERMREEALKFARISLRLDKNDLKAELIIAESTSTSLMDFMKKLEKLIKKGEKALKNVYHIEEEDKGAYWDIPETRPYILVRMKYAEVLASAGMKRKAVEELEEILALSKKDGICARYLLITLYADLEEYEKAEALYKKFKEETVDMMLPMAFMNFKRQSYVKSKNLIKKLAKKNKETKRFFEKMIMGDMDLITDGEFGMEYIEGSLYEYIEAFNENVSLYADGIIFAKYALSVLEEN